MDRFEEIKHRRLYSSVAEAVAREYADLEWLIREVESLRKATAQTSSEIETAHQVLTNHAIAGASNKTLGERIDILVHSEWTPVGEALTALYETYYAQDRPNPAAAIQKLMAAYDKWLD